MAKEGLGARECDVFDAMFVCVDGAVCCLDLINLISRILHQTLVSRASTIKKRRGFVAFACICTDVLLFFRVYNNHMRSGGLLYLAYFLSVRCKHTQPPFVPLRTVRLKVKLMFHFLEQRAKDCRIVHDDRCSSTVGDVRQAHRATWLYKYPQRY